jgi:hypothetical protein
MEFFQRPNPYRSARPCRWFRRLLALPFTIFAACSDARDKFRRLRVGLNLMLPQFIVDATRRRPWQLSEWIPFCYADLKREIA